MKWFSGIKLISIYHKCSRMSSGDEVGRIPIIFLSAAWSWWGVDLGLKGRKNSLDLLGPSHVLQRNLAERYVMCFLVSHFAVVFTCGKFPKKTQGMLDGTSVRYSSAHLLNIRQNLILSLNCWDIGILADGIHCLIYQLISGRWKDCDRNGS